MRRALTVFAYWIGYTLILPMLIVIRFAQEIADWFVFPIYETKKRTNKWPHQQ